MAKESPDDMMVATESGSCVIDGVEVRFYSGQTRIRRDDKLAKAHPQWFTPLDFQAPHETATADPGEKRRTH